MEAYNASGLIHKCDREQIFLKTEVYKDPFGHIRKRAIFCSKSCPVAGTLEDCPHKCNKVGHLYFYVPELLKVGLNRLGCLSVHSYSDIMGITQKLQTYEQQFGSIKTSSFSSPQTFNLIPYKLSRTEIKIKRPLLADGKRTGKKSDGSTWAVQLEILPEWLAQWQNWQKLNALQKLGFSPSPRLIKQVYEVEDIDRNLPLQLPPSEKTTDISTSYNSNPDQPITQEQAQELKKLLKTSNWTPQQFIFLLAEDPHVP